MTAPIFLAVACTPLFPTHQMQNSFNPSDAEPYMLPGNCTITGQAFMRTRGGEAKTAAGLKVELYPATPYFVERYEHWGKMNIEPPMPAQAKQVMREVVCDATGNFEFNGLPPGEYVLYCYIQWLVSASQYSGGVVKGKVTVGEGQSVKILLTGDN